MPELVSSAEIAREFGVSRRTISRYVKDGHLVPTVVLPSGIYRWDIDDVRRQLRQLRQRDGE